MYLRTGTVSEKLKLYLKVMLTLIELYNEICFFSIIYERIT